MSNFPSDQKISELVSKITTLIRLNNPPFAIFHIQLLKQTLSYKFDIYEECWQPINVTDSVNWTIGLQM